MVKRDSSRFSFQEVVFSEDGDETLRTGTPKDYKLDERFDVGEDAGIPQADAEMIQEMSETMGIREAENILRKAVEDHKDDPNFPGYKLDFIKELLDPPKHSDMYQETRIRNMKMEAALIYYHSPYLEVRAVADPFDDPSIPVETFRAYLLGLIGVIVATGVNQFFEPRMPAIAIPAPLLQLLVYPCGMLLAAILPDWGFTIGDQRYTINPGPWSYKEQTLATIMFSITTNLAYVNDMIFVQRMPMFYGNKWAGFGYQFTLFLSTQFIGFGMAGMVRHILVYPVKCLWPSIFPILAMNRALMKPERKESINGWTISQYRFFFIAFGLMFCYYWFPAYLFQALSTFNWTTWIAPQNFNLAAITGTYSGLGINPISTFDWNIVDSLAGPLQTPFFSLANQFAGAVLVLAVIVPAVYYTNMRFTGYIPINSNDVWDNTGNSYNLTQILNEDGVLDQEMYEQYSPAFYSAGSLVMYGAYFIMYPAMIVDSLLRHHKTLYEGFRAIILSLVGKLSFVNEFDDAHSKLMRNYKEVPLWWFLVVIVLALVLSIICVEVYPETETPVWGILMALGIGGIFLVPIGLLFSTSNGLLGLNVLTELITGYALPGKGIALMIIKAIGLNSNQQALLFAQDQKLGHYAKIPPRATFRAQMIASFVEVLVIMGVANWQINNYEGLCDASDPWTTRTKFTCPSEVVVYSSSIVWGVIGPRRVFNQIYPTLPWCFLIGVFIPLIWWGLEKLLEMKSRRLYRKIRQFNPILCLYGMVNYIAPYNLSYILGSFYASLIFMKYIRNRYTQWFEKYVYVFSAGLTAGISLSAIIIFFAVQYDEVVLSWWGNDVPFAGIDGGNYGDRQYPGLFPIPDQGYFGPEPGTFN